MSDGSTGDDPEMRPDPRKYWKARTKRHDDAVRAVAARQDAVAPMAAALAAKSGRDDSAVIALCKLLSTSSTIDLSMDETQPARSMAED